MCSVVLRKKERESPLVLIRFFLSEMARLLVLAKVYLKSAID